MNSSLFDQSFLFFNIAPYAPGKEAELAAAMVEYVQRTRNPYVLYCLSLHPEGKPAAAKVEVMLESYRALKRCLAGTEVKLGILLQAIIGHWPRLDKDEESWTRTIDIQGNIKRFCVLDPRFQEYILYVSSALARENPCFILSDDDVRSFSPEPECFCPLHVAEFNRRLGTNYTSEEMQALIQSQVAGDREYDAFCQMQLDTVTLVSKLLRQGINQVNPDIPSGSCMSGSHYTTANLFAKAMSGHHAPVLRVANADYLENSAKDFPSIVLHTQQFKAGLTDIPYLLDEADSFPHHLYSRSSTGLHAKLVSSIMCGLRGAKLWFVNAFKDGHDINKNYTDILAKYSGFYQKLASEAQNTAMTGVRIPCTGRLARKNYLASHNDIRFTNLGILADKVLGQFGIPFTCTTDLTEDAVYMLSGQEMVERFTDQELKQLLSRKILIDGKAAVALTERGFASFMGVKAADGPVKANIENDLFNGLSYPILAIKPPQLVPVSPETEITSRFYYSDTSAMTNLEDVAPSTVFYRNGLGGYVCVAAFNTDYFFNLLSDTRKIWMMGILEKLNGAIPPNMVLQFQNVATIVRHAPDHDLVAVFNINFDEMVNICLSAPVIPTAVDILSPEGHWLPAEFTCENHQLTVRKPLRCYENAVLRIRY